MGFAYFFFVISNPKQCFCDLTIHHIIVGSSVQLLILDNSDSYFDLFINDLGCIVPRGTLWRPRQILRLPVLPRTAERLPGNAFAVLSLVNKGEGQGPNNLISLCLVYFIISVHFLSLWKAAGGSRSKSVFY